jgi:hypothetical protein
MQKKLKAARNNQVSQFNWRTSPHSSGIIQKENNIKLMIYKLHRRSPYLKDHEQNKTKQNKTTYNLFILLVQQLTIYNLQC